jgi:hypothetical protein
MKTTLFSFLLSALLLLGCNETPVQSEEPQDLAGQSYELIQIPPRLDGGSSFSITETIDGSKGGQINIHEHYITVDGDTVKVDVKLKIEKNCFSGNVDITMTVDDVYTAVNFMPAMVFDKPLELDFKYKGLDPDQLNLTSGNYDFLYIDDNGNTETILSDGVVVKEQNGEISVKNAMLGHFSRFAFAR